MPQAGIYIDAGTGNLGIGTTAPRQYFDVQGGNAIVSGNVGIGTTAPRQLLDVQGGNAIVSGNVGIGTTLTTNLGGGVHIFASKASITSITDTGGNDAQLIVENSSTNVGSSDQDARVVIKAKQTGEADLICYTDDDGVIGWGKFAYNNSLQIAYIDLGTSGALNSGTTVFATTTTDSYFESTNVGIGTAAPRQLLDVQGGNAIVSGNVGIGTTNADYRLVVGDNTARDEIIKVDSQRFAGLILNGDSANTAGEVGGAYVELRIDAGAGKGVLALNQIADQDGKGDTLTDSIANGLVLHNTGNYPIQFGTGGTVKMTIVSGGFVGIGTANPQYKLDVNGSAQVTSTLYVGGVADVNEVQAADGSVSDPSFTFKSDINTGMYRIDENILGFSTGSAERMRISSSGVEVVDNAIFAKIADQTAGNVGTVSWLVTEATTEASDNGTYAGSDLCEVRCYVSGRTAVAINNTYQESIGLGRTIGNPSGSWRALSGLGSGDTNRVGIGLFIRYA